MFDSPYIPVNALSVSDLNRYLRQVMESDPVLQDIWVSGEISNLSRPSSGHIYFTLKDPVASLRCVIWRSAAARIRANLRDGMAVEAHGYISIYEQGGQYQLYADAIRLSGEGNLYQEFLRLKTRLEAEGLFDESRKRPIPRHPRLIGIITSPTGAAIQDMLNTLEKRYPLAEVIIAPTAVQGDTAPLEIVNALRILNDEVHPDVILLGRGGGSLEDLWAFNDERVVRAVAASHTPIITGIGHETDFTLCDFASDLRAPTPTGAAVSASPDIKDIASNLADLNRRLFDQIQSILGGFQFIYTEESHRLSRLSPEWRIQNAQQRLDEMSEKSCRAIMHALELRKMQLSGSLERLHSLNPQSILQRGYAILSTPGGTLIQNIHQVSPGDPVHVRIHDGSMSAQVKEVMANHP